MTQRIPKKLRLKSSVIVITAAFMLQACSMQPKYMSQEDRLALFQADKRRVTDRVEPLAGELTLSEALARGLKYNVDYRIRMMDQAIALGL